MNIPLSGIGRVALDTRLGCLEPNLDPKSEPQQIINAAKYALRNVATLELKFPFWRYFPTPLWSRYVNNMNYFVEICMKYIQEATAKMKSRTPAEREALGEPSLLERVILSEKDEKIACVMALDLILVGIDTVKFKLKKKNNLNIFLQLFQIYFDRFQWPYVRYFINYQRDQKNKKKFIANYVKLFQTQVNH